MKKRNTRRGDTQRGLPKGFTLIELLVVVLIIGILAAIALPQYNRAVARSRFATIKNLVKSIAVAQEVYYLDNGMYTTNFDDLILQLPADGELNETKDIIMFDWGKCQITTKVTACKNNQAFLSYQQYYDHATSSMGQTKCLSWNDLAAQICLQETQDASPKDFSSSTGPYKVYIYQ